MNSEGSRKKQVVVDRLAKELHSRLLGDQVIEDSFLKINWEVTRKIQKEEKYVRFNEWCEKHGVKCPSLEWPVAYGPQGELIGVRAKKDIETYESYLYIPVKITINHEQFKRSWIGELYDKIVEEYEERDNADHYVLIFFVAYQMSIGKKSFWYSYFEIAADSDLPMFWSEEDLALLDDNALKLSIEEQMAEVEEEYEVAIGIVENNQHLIDPKKFTFDVFKRAASLVMTRAFGWSLPYMMLVPYADNCNHHCVENYFEMFNSRLARRQLRGEKAFSNFEKEYFTRLKNQINFFKHYVEDEYDDEVRKPEDKIKQTTVWYYSKLQQRDKVLALTPTEFLEEKEFQDKNIWDLDYISTSDEEDNDSEEDQSSEEEDSEEDEDGEPKPKKKKPTEEETKENEEEQKKFESILEKEKAALVTGSQMEQSKMDSHQDIFKKNVEGQGSQVPPIAKRLKIHRTGRERVRYQYTYETEEDKQNEQNAKKSVIIKKKSERPSPGDLIELLTREKKQLWDQDQLQKLVGVIEAGNWKEEVEIDEGSDEDEEEENFAWYNINDNDTFFVLTTMSKHVYKQDDQVFHCYGRRTNSYLLGYYGFTMTNNKYNSLQFKVNLDFKAAAGKDSQGQVSKMIKLKKDSFRDEVLAYVRSNLMMQNEAKIKNDTSKTEQERKELLDKQSYLLVSSPVDPQFEMLVVGCAINLLEGLKKAKFQKTLEEDKAELKKEGISSRLRFALVHRIGQQEILDSNLKLMQILMRLLARFQGGDIKQVKEDYLKVVEDFETEKEIIPNRLKLRKYLRELTLNQKRILYLATELAMKEKGLKAGASEEGLNEAGSFSTNMAKADEIAEFKKREFCSFLEALEDKLESSSTLFFDNSASPTEDLDLKLMEEIKKKDLNSIITEDDFPNLFKWKGALALVEEQKKVAAEKAQE